LVEELTLLAREISVNLAVATDYSQKKCLMADLGADAGEDIAAF
jgi:hypothetical protein